MHSQRFVAEREARWIEEKIAPNIYAVASLKQGFMREKNGEKLFFRGSSDTYDRATAATLNNLSRKIYGNAYRRYGKQLAVATTLEGDGQLVRHHLNFLIRKPEHMAFGEFHLCFWEAWRENDWFMPEFTFEMRTGDCVRYALKEGPEALLPFSTRF